MPDEDDFAKGVVIGAGIALGLVALIKIMEAMEDDEEDDDED